MIHNDEARELAQQLFRPKASLTAVHYKVIDMLVMDDGWSDGLPKGGSYDTKSEQSDSAGFNS